MMSVGTAHFKAVTAVVSATGTALSGRRVGCFLFFQTECRDNTCVHGSLVTFGNDSPLYGHPSGGSGANRYVCNTH